jgi:sialate O-acetylesterase
MRKIILFVSSLAALCIAAGRLSAVVKPVGLFGDHMVLQSGMLVPVWGTAAPGEKVTLTIADQRMVAVAGADGRWRADFSNLQPGGPLEMTIAGDQTPAPLVIKDVLVGEVWIGSGQSNMEFKVSKKQAAFAGLLNEDQEIAAANYPKIRMFTAKSAKTYEPRSAGSGSCAARKPCRDFPPWATSSPATCRRNSTFRWAS